MDQSQEIHMNKYLFWGIQTLLGLIITIMFTVSNSYVNRQAEIDAVQDAKILNLQEQTIELLKNDAAKTETLKEIQKDVQDNTEMMREGFREIKELIRER